MYVGRLAPSPTGALHLGNVRTFMIAWLRARSQGGRILFRMEDLDHPRDKPGAAQEAINDLRWLGFDWDDACVQSQRKPLYRDALEFLRKGDRPHFQGDRPHSEGDCPHPQGDCPHTKTGVCPRVYPCVCSRKDVETAQSAPHDGEQLRYAGKCRDRFKTWQEAVDFIRGQTPMETSGGLSPLRVGGLSPVRAGGLSPLRMPCWRFRVEEGTVVSFDDAFAGRYVQDVSATLGDFPLARDEGGAGYTLACTVDDLLTGVTEVVRGDDLLPATPAQILLARALLPWCRSVLPAPQSTLHAPTYCHVPLVVGPDGRRLAKRHGDTRVSSFRAAGWRPERLLGLVASTCGWAQKGESISLRDLIPRFTLSTLPHKPVTIDLT